MNENSLIRALWGSGDGTFGYIEAGLPAITHTHTRGSMDIWGNFGCDDDWLNPRGAFGQFQDTAFTHNVAGGGNTHWFIDFWALRTWTGATSNNSNVSAIYGKSDTVQPAALKFRVKTRFK